MEPDSTRFTATLTWSSNPGMDEREIGDALWSTPPRRAEAAPERERRAEKEEREREREREREELRREGVLAFLVIAY